jgi:PKHD-type hydroxylase
MNLNVIPGVLSATQLSELRARLATASWQDGRATAGEQATKVKRNLQVDPESEEGKVLAGTVRQVVAANETFRSLALPRRLSLPLLSRYQVGMEYGPHTDDAYGRDYLRTDLAATLFLSDLASYDGGALSINGNSLRLPAGDMVLYPASSIHRVTAVTRGERLAAVFWVQSLIRDPERRDMVVSLDAAIKKLEPGAPQLAVSRVHQNLLRMWSEA